MVSIVQDGLLFEAWIKWPTFAENKIQCINLNENA